MSKIEILAPAGNFEMLVSAVYSGADAVYLGLEGFNARRSAGNFTASALKEAVAFCRARNVKVYVTLNTILYGKELPLFLQAAKAVAQSGADAAIVQDLATASLLKKYVPELVLHASTQMSIHSVHGAKMAKELGFSRVVLARELSLAEIKEIKQSCDIELECFVHGAMCMSVSGQCYMSAFFGGRSGNRGACAGPCRLPFSAGEVGECHLSLKDMSVIDHLQQMQEIGVLSAKIEGRLRSPEYVAAAVNACVSSREGLDYNANLLQDIFSRSGFTDGYLMGKIGGDMFGVRTEANSAAAKAAMPQLRELFRRELQKIPVDMVLKPVENGVELSISDDDSNNVNGFVELELQEAQKLQDYTKALQKTGGTPFILRNADASLLQSKYLPMSAINELRRQVLEDLLQKRSEIKEYEFVEQDINAPISNKREIKELAVRFESVNQMPESLLDIDYLLLPLTQWQQVPLTLRHKTVLYLPRVLFGALEKSAEKMIEKASAEKTAFWGFTAENIAHFSLLKGKRIFSNFGLNVSNYISFDQYEKLGASVITSSVEVTLPEISQMHGNAKTAVLAYGHMPLMLTRACPLQNVQNCENCKKEGVLTDRKNMELPVKCQNGVRTVYNAVPLYMGDRIKEISADIALLYFTKESSPRVRYVLEMFKSEEKFDGEFTRGLYYKGTSDI